LPSATITGKLDNAAVVLSLIDPFLPLANGRYQAFKNANLRYIQRLAAIRTVM
jgi:hypothetical protein